MRRKSAPGANRFGARNDSQQRQEIAAEAARIIAEQGIEDYGMAKRKAAQRLNFGETRNLPTNQEVDGALRDHLGLFHPEQAGILARLREVALEVMDMLQVFEPRLVGSVLSGTATRHSGIELHVVTDTPENIYFHLSDRNIPTEQGERRVRFGDRVVLAPTYHFFVDGNAIDLTAFNTFEVRELPLSPIDGRPIQRATRDDMRKLLQIGR